MTNHIKEALTALSELETLTKNAPNGIKHSYDIADKAQTHALLAIAEQLRIMNLIKLGKQEIVLGHHIEEGVISDATGVHPYSDTVTDRGLRPDVVEALGIKEEK